MLTSRQDHHFCSNNLIHSICLNLKWECKSTPTKNHFSIIWNVEQFITFKIEHNSAHHPHSAIPYSYLSVSCLLTFAVGAEECCCCMDVNWCTKRLEEVGKKEGQCIRNHPGFESVCLNWWVLQAAGASSKTRSKKSYTTVLTLVGRAEAEQVWSLYFCRKGHVSQHK